MSTTFYIRNTKHKYTPCYLIGYRRANQKRTIQRNWRHKVHKTKKNKTITLVYLISLG